MHMHSSIIHASCLLTPRNLPPPTKNSHFKPEGPTFLIANSEVISPKHPDWSADKLAEELYKSPHERVPLPRCKISSVTRHRTRSASNAKRVRGRFSGNSC